MNLEDIKRIILKEGKTVFDFPTYFPEWGGEPEEWMKNIKFITLDEELRYPHPLSSAINTYLATMVTVNSGSVQIRAKVEGTYMVLGSSPSNPSEFEYHRWGFIGEEARKKLVSYFEKTYCKE